VTGATILSLVVLAFVLSAAGAVSLMLNRRLQRAG
jgi:hypothetical protein